jgi:PhzF family phenazine biosynthesis protein
MRILVVDSFTDRPFAGNPAGVCLLDGPADPLWMQQVAAEMRHAETAFVRPAAPPAADYELRWFTPLMEVALCGHATLASAHALYETGTVDTERPVRFQTLKSGVLTVRRRGDGLEMDFPATPPEPAEPVPGLAEALGAKVLWTGRSLHDILVQVADERTVRELSPDFQALGRYDGTTRGIIVTAAADPGGPSDYVSRFFAPAAGVREDPVTGSAHCALAPFWSARLGRDELTGYQASQRGGLVGTVLRGDRVLLTGRAVTVLDGTLHALPAGP